MIPRNAYTALPNRSDIMKKFNLRGVLDGLRSSVTNSPKLEIDIEETLRSEHFKVTKVHKSISKTRMHLNRIS